MADKSTGTDLGFVEETDSWRLLSHFFPSKVGGNPAWLSLKPIPKADDVTCSKCGKPCIFLMQIYAPDDQEKDTCFHRTVFVFVCREPACCKQNSNSNFVVFRSQLPRVNDFYSDEPSTDDTFDASGDYPRADAHESLCVVCGISGPKRCARCQKATYCSKEHQTIDWKAGHKTHCKSGSGDAVEHQNFLLKEFELVTEAEPLAEHDGTERTDDEKMKEYEKLVASEKTGTLVDSSKEEADLEKMARKESADDKMFKRFKKRVSHEPEQVLRYDRGGAPLWVSNEGVPSTSDIPTCSCGSPRSFEFQVMPQLLNFLKLDDLHESIDWGTLAIYTCSVNCEIGSVYKKEFLWKQDFSNTDVV